MTRKKREQMVLGYPPLVTARVASVIADCTPATISRAKQEGWLTPVGRRGGNGPEVYALEDVLQWMKGELPKALTVLSAPRSESRQDALSRIDSIAKYGGDPEAA